MGTMGVIIGAIVLALLFAALCLYLPIYFVKGKRFPNDEYNAIDNTRKTLAQICGGAAIILTFAWTFLKDSETLDQARQQNANQEFISSAQLLSRANNTATRAAGIYSFERLAKARTEYHIPVTETLIAFLSDATSLAIKKQQDRPERIETDIQALVNVIGKRDTSYDDKYRQVILDHQYLAGASFFMLSGFKGASFQDAYLYGADFRFATLDNARFDGAHLEDYSGYGQKWRNNIADKREWEEWEKYRYIANFEGASLQGTTFTGAGLSGAKFYGSDLSGTNFVRANLSRTDFRGSKNIEHAKFEDASGKACADVPPKFDDGLSIRLGPCP